MRKEEKRKYAGERREAVPTFFFFFGIPNGEVLLPRLRKAPSTLPHGDWMIRACSPLRSRVCLVNILQQHREQPVLTHTRHGRQCGVLRTYNLTVSVVGGWGWGTCAHRARALRESAFPSFRCSWSRTQKESHWERGCFSFPGPGEPEVPAAATTCPCPRHWTGDCALNSWVSGTPRWIV